MPRRDTLTSLNNYAFAQLFNRNILQHLLRLGANEFTLLPKVFKLAVDRMLKALRLDLDLDLLELIRKTVCDTGDDGDKLELDKPAANMQVCTDRGTTKAN